ncbi:RluA family pseudouridine synthase [Ligilactobacillus apodemi]|uniref:Pseudouridine synthase n=1 Tax=Ligilactobacillus apodemi DSM 16634 = JCM 16172 TaxID=1423724 RepID=A0A0R1U1C1_9LACO|nr:RluA family pseudouridine synthase [Ligilactobacillus apodemi]KRL87216.1 ribosomal large subunit pseudouridine synthase D [Ligilactobacillus apodemi DSM 16634 = JCM 16172]
MEITWQNKDGKEQSLKRFLRKRGVSQRLYRKLQNGFGAVKLDGQKVQLATTVPKNATVTLCLPAEGPDETVEPSFAPIDVIYEDKYWLVVNKEAGLTSVPGPSNRTDTLVNRVKGYLQQKNAFDQAPRIITRLDRYTSGLVLFAKHSFAQAQIATQVSSHLMDKRYLALVTGEIKEKHGFIEGPIARKENDVKYLIDPAGKPAKSEYWCEAKNAELSLVRVKLHTGRTHQIRVHFSENGHPLLGDKLYGGSRSLIARQALHAYRLSFDDPFSQKKLSFTAPVPADMEKVITQAF